MGSFSHQFLLLLFVGVSYSWIFIDVPKSRSNSCGCTDEVFCSVIYINPKIVNQAERSFNNIKLTEAGVSIDVVFDALTGDSGAGVSGTLVGSDGRPYSVEPCTKNTDSERQFHKRIRQHIMVKSDDIISDRTRLGCCGSADACEKVEINKDLFNQSVRTGVYLETSLDPDNYFDKDTADYFQFKQVEVNTNNKIYDNGRSKLTLSSAGGHLTAHVNNRYDEVLNSLGQCGNKGYFWKSYDESVYRPGARTTDGERGNVNRGEEPLDYYDLLAGSGVRAAQGPDTCYYNIQKFCSYEPDKILNDTMGTIVLDSGNSSDSIGQNWCNTQCLNTASCEYFTWQKYRDIQTCYLLYSCNEIRRDPCLGTIGNPIQSCMSGPKNCTPIADNANCATLVDHGPGYITWQCTDYLGNPVDAYNLTSIPWGTICVQSCDSWRAKGSNTSSPIEAHLKSVCKIDGSWTNTVAYDGQGDLLYPAPTSNSVQNPTSLYPVPNDPATVSLSCECETLEVRWPTVSGLLNNPSGSYYNPNTENVVDFLCDYAIDTSLSEYKIYGNNTCTLFCSNMYQATVRCWDGKWTGNPEAGFWCKSSPSASGSGPTYL